MTFEHKKRKYRTVRRAQETKHFLCVNAVLSGSEAVKISVKPCVFSGLCYFYKAYNFVATCGNIEVTFCLNQANYCTTFNFMSHGSLSLDIC